MKFLYLTIFFIFVDSTTATPSCTSKPNCAEISCSNEYAPICGSDDGLDGKTITFSSPCNMELINCLNPSLKFNFLHDGECVPQCITACAEIYQPICSVDCNGNEKVWGNQCELDSYNCLHPYEQYEAQYDGECSCLKVCTQNYSPICAADSTGNLKTFSHQCDLDNYNCEHKEDQYSAQYEGECIEDTPTCLKVCTQNYSPICASDNTGKTKVFSHQCDLDNYNCEHKEDQYTFLNDGECKLECICCLKVCTENYSPICAADSTGNLKTFSHQCDLDNYNCEHKANQYSTQYDGECVEDTPSCLKVCDQNYSPICARNSSGNLKTFSHQCDLDNYNCEHQTDQYAKSYDGECKEDCNDICQETYKPTYEPYCGISIFDENVKMNFSNHCHFDSWNCFYPKDQYKIVHEGECAEDGKSCLRVCTQEYTPICATDVNGAGLFKTFSHNCDLDNYNCNHKEDPYFMQYSGECEENTPSCLQVCTQNYTPICAKNGTGDLKTFSHQCDLDNYNCEHTADPYTKTYDGECKRNCDDICEETYTPTHEPLCGVLVFDETIAKNFSNHCHFDVYNCLNPDEQYKFKHEGECADKENL